MSWGDGTNFNYSIDNRLKIFVSASTNASYSYDPFGRRVKKEVNGQVTYYLWDEDHVFEEYSASGTTQQRYSYIPRRYSATETEDVNGVYVVHNDHLDTPKRLSDTNQAIVWHAEHEAFGASVINADSDGNGVDVVFNQRFPGQYYDGEAGLYYNYLRDYDTHIGRYLQSDPIGLAGGHNLFLYASANPLGRIDPIGTINFEPPFDPENPIIDPENPPKPKNPHNDPDVRPAPQVPEQPRPDVPKPGDRGPLCTTIYKGCMAVCASPACPPFPALKIGCAAACFAAYVACVSASGGGRGD